MALRKITDAEISAKGVVAAPDVLNGTAAENKATFDRLVRELVAVCFNDLVDQLEALGVDAIIQTKSENMKYLRVVDGALQYSADGAKWAGISGGSGEGASGWPFGVLLESQNCTYTGVQYNEDVEMNRIGEAPADIRYLFDGEVSVTRGGVTKTVTIYDDILADEGGIPDGVDGVFLCNSLDGKRYNLYLRDAEICPDGEGLGCVNIIALADTWPAGIYVDISNGTDTARVNAITYAALSRVPMEYLDYEAATKKYVKDRLAGIRTSGGGITTEFANIFSVETVTIAASDWSSSPNEAGYYLTTVYGSSKIGLNKNIDVIIQTNSNATVEDSMMKEAARCGVICYDKVEDTADGALFFRATKRPTIDLTFDVRIWNDNALTYTWDSDTLTLTVTEG